MLLHTIAELLDKFGIPATEVLHWLQQGPQRSFAGFALHLAGLFALLVYVVGAVAGARVAVEIGRLGASVNATSRRKHMANMVTGRMRETKPGEVHNFARALSGVRRRSRHWWTEKGGAVRFRLDSIADGGMLHSMEGPPWMNTLLNTSNFFALQLVEFDKLDLTRMTPKGMKLDWEHEDSTYPTGGPTDAAARRWPA